MHKIFACNRKCILFATKWPGCYVSVFSDTSSVRDGLFLPLADNFLPVRIIVDDVEPKGDGDEG